MRSWDLLILVWGRREIKPWDFRAVNVYNVGIDAAYIMTLKYLESTITVTALVSLTRL